MVLHRRGRVRRGAGVVCYRGQRRGGVFGKVLNWVVKLGKGLGTKIAAKAGSATKETVKNMVKDAGKKLAKKVTDPATLRKLAKEGATAGLKYAGNKLMEKEEPEQKKRPIRRIVIRKRRV